MLLLEANHVVPVDRLIDALWGDEPPATARGQIQICISSLRRRLFAVSGRDLIQTRSPGYRLLLEDGSLDLHRFEALVAQAENGLTAGDLMRAARDLRAGLALWHGAALAGIVSRLVRTSAARLDERRMAVLGQCLDLEMDAGGHHQLIGELVELVAEHPLREHFRALLMTALYRAGRQAEALETYRRSRDVLMDELGIEPGEELRRLHQAMLASDLPLGAAEHPETEASTPAEPAPVVRTPNLLPAAIPDFTGRRELVAQLLEQMGGTDPGRSEPAVRVGVIVGPGGAGKSTLAIHLAHLLAPEFPDGQLFARLRVGDGAVSPSDILERFLRALGVPGASMPDNVDERAELFRDLLGSRRVLILLDDAMSEQQVESLLPGNAQCAVLVTSRRRLTGMPSVSRVEIGAFSQGSAYDLLARIVGADRVAAEPEYVVRLCQFCGNLPLALRIVAARLAARPHWSVADLVDRLADESSRLDELHHGEMGVRASISLTHEGLSADARVLFRRLVMLESPNFPSWVAGPLLAVDVRRAQDVLEELTEAYLIDTEPGGTPGQVRYRLRDIMRSFAHERLVEDSAADQRAAMERWFGALLALTGEAHRREYAGDFLHPHTSASRQRLPDSLVDRLLRDPLAWFEQERLFIVCAVRQAAEAGLVEHCWGIALSAVTLFESRSYLQDWRETHQVALKAARSADDQRGIATMLYSLGSLHLFEQDGERAAELFEQAQARYDSLGDRHGTALVLRNIAHLDYLRGDLDAALRHGETALGMLQVIGDRIAEAHTLQTLAQVRLLYGEDAVAEQLLQRAAHICEQLGNRRVGAQVQYRLGELLMRRGELARAAESYQHVLRAVRRVGDQVGECYALLGVAASLLGRSDAAAAARTLVEAQELAVSTSERLAQSRIELMLAEVAMVSGSLEVADAHARTAEASFAAIGAALYRARALGLHGQIHRSAGRPSAALACWREARTVVSELKLDGALVLVAELDQQIASLDWADGAAPVADSHLDLSA